MSSSPTQQCSLPGLVGSAGRTQHLHSLLWCRELLNSYKGNKLTERLQPDFRQRAMEDQVPFRVWEPCSPCASALPQAEHSGCRMQGEAAAADAFLQISPDSMLPNRRLYFPFTVSASGQKSWRSSNMVGTKSLPFLPPVRLPKREKYKYLLCLCFMPCHPLLPEQRPQSSIQHQQNQALSLCQQCSKAFWLPR